MRNFLKELKFCKKTKKLVEFLLLDKNISVKYSNNIAANIEVKAVNILSVYNFETKVNDKVLKKLNTDFKTKGYFKLKANSKVVIGTGIKVNLPKNIDIQVKDIGENVLTKGYFTIDNITISELNNFKKEIGIILYNFTPYSIVIKRYSKIAQIILKKVFKPKIKLKNYEKS